MDKQSQPEHPTPGTSPDAGAAPAASETSYAAQRRYPRIKCFIAVQVRPETDQGLVLGNLADVSQGGCGVESANHVPLGVPVALCPLTSAGEIWVKGIVVNSRFSDGTGSFHLGVRFLEELPPSDHHQIGAFVRCVEETVVRHNPGGPYLSKLWGL